jgi:hypothetical protein
MSVKSARPALCCALKGCPQVGVIGYPSNDGSKAPQSVGLRQAKYGDDILPRLGKGMREHMTPSRTEPGGFNKLQARIRKTWLATPQPSHRDATHSRVSVHWCAERSPYELDPGNCATTTTWDVPHAHRAACTSALRSAGRGAAATVPHRICHR